MTERYTKLQVNAMRDRGEVRETFVHTDLGGFDITGIRNFILMRPQLFKVWRCKFAEMKRDGAPDEEDVLAWLIGEREVDWDRVAVLTENELNDPAINLMDKKGNSYLVDGIHRIAGRHKAGMDDFPFYAMPLVFAQANFQIPEHLLAQYDRPWGKKDVRDGKLVDSS